MIAFLVWILAFGWAIIWVAIWWVAFLSPQKWKVLLDANRYNEGYIEGVILHLVLFALVIAGIKIIKSTRW